MRNRGAAMKILKLDAVRFAVITATRSDYDMRLTGTTLSSHEERGSVRVGGLIRIVLGPKSFAIVTALKIGESWKG